MAHFISQIWVQLLFHLNHTREVDFSEDQSETSLPTKPKSKVMSPVASKVINGTEGKQSLSLDNRLMVI